MAFDGVKEVGVSATETRAVFTLPDMHIALFQVELILSNRYLVEALDGAVDVLRAKFQATQQLKRSGNQAIKHPAAQDET